MTAEEIRAKVRCSACNGQLGHDINLVELNRAATWAYPTSGNVLTGEQGIAVGICCDRCIEENRTIVEAVEFGEDGPVYHPVADLVEVERAPHPDDFGDLP